jgi:hypothetical protein
LSGIQEILAAFLRQSFAKNNEPSPNRSSRFRIFQTGVY